MDNKYGITYEIIQHLGTLSERIDKTDRASKWTLELNIVSFNGRLPLYDLREWSEDHTQMRNGIRLNNRQIDTLRELLVQRHQKEVEADREEQAI